MLVLKPQLLLHVGHPAFSEALPREHVDGALSQHRPQRHLDRAGVGGRDDAQAVVVGDAEERLRLLDHRGQPLFAGPAEPCKA